MISPSPNSKKHLRLGILFCVFAFIILLPATFDTSSNTIRLQTANACTTDNYGDCSFSQLTADCTGRIVCNAQDQVILRVLENCGKTGGLSFDPSQCTDQQRVDSAKAQAINDDHSVIMTSSCKSTLDEMASPFTCAIRSMFAGIGSFLMYLGMTVLTWSGLLFEYALKITVVQFSTQIFSSVELSVNTAWTAFRDIANIMIIGIFTFIALSIIIGLKEYGQKKLIANVLIIAVLINFSLLFTKMAIDASNFVANQFYAASVQETDQKLDTSKTAKETANGPAVSSKITGNGIAGRFMKSLGITGIQDAYEKLRGIQENNDDAWVALLYGVVSFIFLIAVALVFFYGTFLLVSRAVLLVFLMITASIAFASYLVPSWAGSSYGWSAWWKALMGSIFLAPVLMLLLWVTLNVTTALSNALPGKSTLGDLVTSDRPGENITALLNFLIILGMLFITFKLASKLAGKTAGFNLAAMTSLLPLSLGGQLIGALGRNAPIIGGRGAARRSAALDSDIEAEKIAVAKRREAAAIADRPFDSYRENKKLASLLNSKTKAEELSKRSFNPMNTGLVKATMTGLGVSGFAAGADKKLPSFAETAKARADAAAKKATDASVSAESAKEALNKQYRTQREKLESDRTNAASIVDAVKGAAQKTKDASNLDKQHEVAKQKIRTEEAEIEKIHEKRRSGVTRTDAQRDTELTVQKARIIAAQDAATQIRDRIEVIDKPIEDARKKLSDVEASLRKFDDAIGREAEKLAKTGNENARDVAARIAHRRFSNILPRMLGESPKSDYTSNLARGLVKKKIKAQGAKERQEADRAILEGAGEGAKAPGTP